VEEEEEAVPTREAARATSSPKIKRIVRGQIQYILEYFPKNVASLFSVFGTHTSGMTLSPLGKLKITHKDSRPPKKTPSSHFSYPFHLHPLNFRQLPHPYFQPCVGVCKCGGSIFRSVSELRGG
jgi:hypothetical protein